MKIIEWNEVCCILNLAMLNEKNKNIRAKRDLKITQRLKI